MKTIEEQIKVMQHYADGGDIESFDNQNCYANWQSETNPVWDWFGYDYRIKKVDPYAELKVAATDPTKQIRIVSDNYYEYPWRDAESFPWAWCFPPENYEIRDKPKQTIKMQCWFNGTSLEWLNIHENNIPYGWKRVPTEDKVIEL